MRVICGPLCGYHLQPGCDGWPRKHGYQLKLESSPGGPMGILNPAAPPPPDRRDGARMTVYLTSKGVRVSDANEGIHGETL